MKTLSIIIVNYNVKFFIEQCLYSVQKAINNLNCEVIVVDNNSVDGSCSLIKNKFNWVNLVENKENLGFSKANNQGIKIATGKYILLLNPDTVVEEDTFQKVIDFMEQNSDAGGLGVKMIDGKGNFLPESKRGLPTPKVAFYKIFGLSKIFKSSKTFGKYHLSYLDKNKIHKVDVLSGAFMLMRKEVLDKIGYLDEAFFMYGEDIDLSYRIKKAGYENYYFPKTTIIHYKGESTKKSSINYVIVFYNAMIIFAKKHFTNQNARLFSNLIKLAIYFRASLAILNRLFKSILLPAIDSLLIFFTFFLITPIWENYKFNESGIYPKEFYLYAIPAYILIWITSIFFTGGYDKPLNSTKSLKGFLLGTFVILILYALVGEELRFSRALILMGGILSISNIYLCRQIIKKLNFTSFPFENKTKKIVIVGDFIEANKISNFLSNIEFNKYNNIVGIVRPENILDNNNYIGSISQLKDIVTINKINEVIFCAGDIQSNSIIQNMLDLASLNIEYKIASKDGLSIIGSNSINSNGEIYSISINSIIKPENIRIKRTFDIFSSILLIILSPAIFFLINHKFQFFKNLFIVLFGIKTWVGYINSNENFELPKIKKSIINPISMKKLNNEMNHLKINIQYAKDYKVFNDFKYLIINIKYLGNK